MDRILAIHTGHDASIALWHDYEQVAIFKEERLNRIKNWGKGFPELSFEKIKEYISIGEIDVVLLSRNYYDAKYFRESMTIELKKFIKKVIGRKEQVLSLSMSLRMNNTTNEHDVFNVIGFLSDLGFRDNIEIRFCDHHRAHYLPTLFYNPDWSNALLYTSDGGGDGINYSFTHFDGGEIEEIYGGSDLLMEHWLPDSMGQMYGLVTEICGFRKNRHEGKITGLAAFAEPIKADHIIGLYEVNSSARIIPKFSNYDSLRKELQSIYDQYGREVLSASAQIALEKLTVASLVKLKEKYQFENIGLSGGVCANVRLNQKISEIDGVNDIFVFPPMGDEGLVVGYILDYLKDRDGTEFWLRQRRFLDNMYWGEEYPLSTKDVPDNTAIIAKDNIAEVAADLLVNNKICAIYTSRMEYGPRALGARSILINPSDKAINHIVNKRLDRTEFMPFAPYVMEEMVDEVFETTNANSKAMRFMTITTNVKEKWKDKIQATVHVDGTARPQVVDEQQNKLYYDILKKYYAKTGIPCLVNTSFNAHEEPIINSPEEAITALLDDRVDYLILDNMIIGKRDVVQ